MPLKQMGSLTDQLLGVGHTVYCSLWAKGSTTVGEPGTSAVDLTAKRTGTSDDRVIEPRQFHPQTAPRETDFVLVSCGGAGMEEGEDKDRVVKAKREGERLLRNSGLGYTIVRPGTLLEEPGGNKALVFDQGDRITQSISCADVADVCVKALHAEEARNKSFDVCYEYGAAEGAESQYERVANVPNRSNNYLTPALSVLEKNT